jgi:sialate O-acetylesterase
MTRQRLYILCLFVAFSSQLFAQNINPASIFGNNMVIQQGINAPIWGTAKPNQKLTLLFADKVQKTKADKTGKWMVKLPIMKAGGPYKMLISSGKDSVMYPSVFVGEVWLAGGQSNMQLLMPEIKNAGKEIADANYLGIRFFTVGMNISHKPVDKVKGEWQICTPENAKKFSATAYFFARELHQQKQVPVGIIASSWGSSPAEAWTSSESLLTYPDFKDSITKYQQLQADWELLYANYLADRETLKTQPTSSKKPVLPLEKNYPSALYNAMIAPLVPYGIKGIIWYQGENNARKAFQYRSLFPLLINDWRSKWNNNNLPFVFVQLANHKVKNTEPVFKDEWALLREAQLMALQVPNTGMAVTIDIGEANNIHPKNKQDVGKRLFLAANHLAYNNTTDTYSGPIYQSINIISNEAEISFTHIGKGLVIKGDTLTGFAIAGADKKFYWANAKVKGEKVIVSSPMVANPVAVRYAWASNPNALFYNLDGLPASPFRTDEW